MRNPTGLNYITLPGLYVRKPYAIDLAYGRKTVETRGYRPPEKYLGEWVAIIETGSQKSSVVGIASLCGWDWYADEEEWEADASRHLIPTGDPQYGWGTTKEKYGWQFRAAIPAWHYAEAFAVRKGGRIWTSVSVDHALFHGLVLQREERNASPSGV